ncbi:MAG: PP2C family protein-serine/threonine phosphatase, partial [Acidobacteria bacterium]|nr:PP2C family protein-serine/threonine phosphatase [Acidobacteriota bacterium]
VRLVAEALERQRLEQELRLARAIQVAILPPSLPVLTGYEIHAGNIPSRGVSGDFYKVSLRAEGRECVIFQTDVSGKGVSAALLTASLEALLAVPLKTVEDPHAVLDLVSSLLFERTPVEKYATAFLGILDVDTGRLRYVNAGHNAPLLLRHDGEAVWLKSNGFPIGLRPDARYSTVEARLERGDLLLVYTDGISEATNPEEEEFGLPRLLAASRNHRDKPPREFALALERDVDLFVRGEPYADDRTVVVLRRLG